MTDIQQLLSNFVIALNGSQFEPDLAADVVEVTVENSLHLPDMATIKISDPQVDWIDDSRFTPGATIEISAGYGPTASQIFDGEIVEIEPVFASDGAPYLVVRAFDKLHRLTYGRYMRSFLNVTDKDVIAKIAGEVGLAVDVGSTSTLHKSLIQSGQTNLEFLQQRAAALGFLLYVDGDKLVCKPPASASEVSLQMYQDLTEFRPRLTTVGQSSKVLVRGWDSQAKRPVVGQASSGSVRPQIGVSKGGGAMVKSAFSLDATFTVAAGNLADQDAAQKLAQAILDGQESRYIQAEGTTLGNPKIRAGSKVKVAGAGDRFSGTYFITASTHSFDLTNGYITSFGVSGMQPNTLVSMLSSSSSASASVSVSAESSSSSGGSYSFAVGVVTDNKDPENLGRVKVKYPMIADDFTGFWARVATPDAGNNRGFQFIPEVNDEVLVGFVMGDLNHPIVLGSLWNGHDAAPLPATQAIQGGQVNQRIIRSRTGHQILIDDSDDKGGITIKDKKGNLIYLKAQDNSLTIETTGDIKLTTKGNLNMDVTGNASFKTQGNLALEATGNLSLKANGQAELNGVSGTKVESSAMVDVKGAMINLN